MMENPKNVLLDTCVLINFLCIDRTDLLADHPHYCFMLTDHVRGEISEHYSEQLIRLENLLLSAKVEEITVNTPQELQAFAELSSDGRLGAGECSAIAAASYRGIALAMDDKKARRKAISFFSSIELLDTKMLMLSMIETGMLDFSEADAIKNTWEQEHSFKLNFGSFRDISNA